MRDPEKLLVFQDANSLAEEVYRVTADFPIQERYGLTNQIRRAAMSVPSNLVEGCSRESVADFRRFVEIALGSAMELHYQLGFALRMNMVTAVENVQLLAEARDRSAVVGKSLNNLIRSLRAKSQEPRAKSQ